MISNAWQTSIGVTCLLSMVVFLVVLTEITAPDPGGSIPLLGIFFALLIVLIITISVMAAIVTWVHYHGEGIHAEAPARGYRKVGYAAACLLRLDRCKQHLARSLSDSFHGNEPTMKRQRSEGSAKDGEGQTQHGAETANGQMGELRGRSFADSPNQIPEQPRFEHHAADSTTASAATHQPEAATKEDWYILADVLNAVFFVCASTAFGCTVLFTVIIPAATN